MWGERWARRRPGWPPISKRQPGFWPRRPGPGPSSTGEPDLDGDAEAIQTGALAVQSLADHLAEVFRRLDGVVGEEVETGWRGRQRDAFGELWEISRGRVVRLEADLRGAASILTELATALSEAAVSHTRATTCAGSLGLVVVEGRVEPGRACLSAPEAVLGEVQAMIDRAQEDADAARRRAAHRLRALEEQIAAVAPAGARSVRIAASGARQLERRAAWWAAASRRAADRLETLGTAGRLPESTLARLTEETRQAEMAAARLSEQSDRMWLRALRWGPEVRFLDRVPGLGYAATAVSVAADIARGEDWRMALARETLSLASGALVALVTTDVLAGTALAGTLAVPVIVVTAGAVTGYLVAEETPTVWDDLARGARAIAMRNELQERPAPRRRSPVGGALGTVSVLGDHPVRPVRPGAPALAVPVGDDERVQVLRQQALDHRR